MITKRVVFVVGAGASSPYGFPTGAELLNRLKSSDGYGSFQELVPELGRCFDSDWDLDRFRAALNDARCGSIDEFVEHRPEFTHPAKALLAYNLLPHERVPVRATDPDEDWYE